MNIAYCGIISCDGYRAGSEAFPHVSKNSLAPSHDTTPFMTVSGSNEAMKSYVVHYTKKKNCLLFSFLNAFG